VVHESQPKKKIVGGWGRGGVEAGYDKDPQSGVRGINL
jgi:hypothetical protein